MTGAASTSTATATLATWFGALADSAAGLLPGVGAIATIGARQTTPPIATIDQAYQRGLVGYTGPGAAATPEQEKSDLAGLKRILSPFPAFNGLDGFEPKVTFDWKPLAAVAAIALAVGFVGLAITKAV